ncbi:MAG: hypothetical protein AMK73_02950 [Planctomycetes bacterium SM23_32]|nr:MAG: hypothetical protein AMK73_02950 [Planctomycetes bacterium SM23_32]
MFDYRHRQTGPWFVLLLLVALGAAGWAVWGALTGQLHPGVRLILIAPAAIFSLLAACVVYLEVRDEGYRLSVQFGPLPIFGTSVLYDDIESVEPARLGLLQGFGLHLVPGAFISVRIRGDEAVCIRLKRRRPIWFCRTVYLGTDDAEGLLEFLRRKIAQGAGQ